jgi:hypothetical protein
MNESARPALDALRRRRLQLRLATAWSGFAVAVLWSLVAAFAIDLAFVMNRPQRFVALLLVAGGIVWAWPQRLAKNSWVPTCCCASYWR